MLEPDAVRAAVSLLKGGARFLCTAHARVDGDALGAMLVSAHGLRALGKEVVLYNQEPVPRRLSFLPGAGDVVRRIGRKERFDATLVHDTGARHLLGDKFPDPEVTGPLIVLDHHAVVSDFADELLRDDAAASSGVISYRLLEALGVLAAMPGGMSQEIAISLLVSLVEDTGWFRYSSTNAEALELSARCVAAGASTWELFLRLDESNPEASLRLLRLVLGSLERHCDGKVALLTMTDEMMHEAQAAPDDVLKFVNYARALRGVEVGALLTLGDKEIYVSLRGKGGIDVATVAAQFGGGGHRNAAGCTLRATAEGTQRQEARARLIAALSAAVFSADPASAR